MDLVTALLAPPLIIGALTYLCLCAGEVVNTVTAMSVTLSRVEELLQNRNGASKQVKEEVRAEEDLSPNELCRRFRVELEKAQNARRR